MPRIPGELSRRPPRRGGKLHGQWVLSHLHSTWDRPRHVEAGTTITPQKLRDRIQSRLDTGDILVRGGTPAMSVSEQPSGLKDAKRGALAGVRHGSHRAAPPRVYTSATRLTRCRWSRRQDVGQIKTTEFSALANHSTSLATLSL